MQDHSSCHTPVAGNSRTEVGSRDACGADGGDIGGYDARGADAGLSPPQPVGRLTFPASLAGRQVTIEHAGQSPHKARGRRKIALACLPSFVFDQGTGRICAHAFVAPVHPAAQL